jgi:CRISPR type III-B/RAMP module-associated protein Cmr3
VEFKANPSALFNWLNIRGPFPVKGEAVYFPRPLDLVPSKTDENTTVAKLLQVVAQVGTSNLPAPLTHVVANRETPSKDKLEDWMSHADFTKYLKGSDGFSLEKLHLWDTEHRIGVELRDDTETAKDGKLYAAEHLRLRPDVRLRFSCSHPPEKHEEQRKKESQKLPSSLIDHTLQLGGEARFGQVLSGSDLVLPSVEITGSCVKWVLLTPAIFKSGWLPGWIGEAGRVLLKTTEKKNRPEFRRNRREGNAPHDAGQEPITATLLAACIGKPQVIGGWDLLGSDSEGKSGVPKATQLAVPSGSVYYFKADSEPEAKKLADALRGRCRSDFYGEKGLGLGVCGMWKMESAKE